MSESSETLFGLLEAQSGATWQSRTTAVEVLGGNPALALDPQGRPSLLVPAPGKSAERKLVTRGLSARVAQLVEGGHAQEWLIVTSQAPSLDRTFFRLCDDVLAQLENLDPDDDPVARTLTVVQRWQNLLAATKGDLLSVEQCAGLLAELHALEAIAAEIGPLAAMTAWVGHDRSRVDFRFDASGIEVKATLNRDRFKVTIHGILQLDDVGVGALHLFAEQLEVVPDGGDTLPSVVRRLVAAGMVEADLREALSRVGYATADEDVYEEIRFEKLGERAVLVGPNTPRIVGSSFSNGVPAAVSGLQYALDLTDFTEQQGLLPDGGRQVFRMATA